MKITFLCVGKTDNKHLDILINEYEGRIKKFIDFKIDYISPPRNFGKLQAKELKKAEGRLILDKVGNDFLILLDERGKTFSSRKFAAQMQKYMNAGYRNIYFLVGGAFGFSEEVYSKANGKISLSEMTTTHQLIRLLFTEQLYRAFTILNNHPYHND